MPASYSYSSMRCDGNEPAPTEDRETEKEKERKRERLAPKRTMRGVSGCVQLKGDDEVEGKSNRHCGSKCHH